MRTLSLENVQIIDKRTHDLAEPFLLSFDVVTARAFAEMSASLEAGVPFLKHGGVMVLSRGPEEAISEQLMAKAGVALEKKIELTLPHSDYRRVIWVFRRTG